MKTISLRSPLPSMGAALVVSGLQFLSAVFPSTSAKANFFDWENLRSDVPGVADRTDSNLVNPWGLALNTRFNVFWVADNGTGVSTIYRPNGRRVPLVVTIPPTPAENPTLPSAPTGIVFNHLPHPFLLSNGLPAAFIFDGEDGRITAWNSGDTAVIKVDNSPSGAVYKGLALAIRPNGGATLYATNFHSGHVDIFDRQFNPVIIANSFVDPNPPPVPMGATGWGPFNIANIDELIYVTFAAQDADKHDDVAGAGNGFIDVFTVDGVFIKRLVTGGLLNSPWGLARVPDHFGSFDHGVLLVGNFGDGHINAYDVNNGTFRGTLHRRHAQPLAFDGLWSLVFLNNERLYFTAGIVDEGDGLFGFIHEQNAENSEDN
jgi:uncharacterized protein (TIGR03118 family)